MSDLVEGLRRCEKHGKRHVGELCGEAADEIERLKESNTALADKALDLEGERNRLRAIINGVCAVLKAPDLDNDGGVTDLVEDVQTLLHNHTMEAQEVERLRAILDDAQHADGGLLE
jgi:hypothetical protein